MSPPGRPKGEYRSAQREGDVIRPPGRPKGEYRSAQREGPPTNRLLADIAYIRSGDKGDNVSIGVLARRPEDYATMMAALTPAAIGALFGEWVKGSIEVHPMPNIDGCLVLLVQGLGGGATRTLRFDQTAKALGNAILRLPLTA